MKKNTKIIISIASLIILLLAWAPWFTKENAYNKVIERLGGPDAQFGYLGESMAVKDIPYKVSRLPFIAFVSFPGEAMWIVLFYGGVIP
ncbi:MAG: hypothetical protein ACKKMP_00900 [Candidatus Nealsonbacteria bacterium]